MIDHDGPPPFMPVLVQITCLISSVNVTLCAVWKRKPVLFMMNKGRVLFITILAFGHFPLTFNGLVFLEGPKTFDFLCPAKTKGLKTMW